MDFRGRAEERRQPLDPLIQKLAAMHQDERVHPAPGDEPGSDDRLAERRGRRQHADVVLRQRVCGDLLFGTQLAVKDDVRSVVPCVRSSRMTVTNPERLECLLERRRGSLSADAM